MADAANHPERPCATCPYRKDAPLGYWAPAEFLDLLKHEEDQRRGGLVGGLYACHGHAALPDTKRGLCAGWLLDQKRRNYPSIRLRVLLASSGEAVAAAESVTDGGFELYESVEAMCQANGVEV